MFRLRLFVWGRLFLFFRLFFLPRRSRRLPFWLWGFWLTFRFRWWMRSHRRRMASTRRPFLVSLQLMLERP